MQPGAHNGAPTRPTPAPGGASPNRGANQFRIVKVYWEPQALQASLADLGWDVEVQAADWAFIYAHGRRRGLILHSPGRAVFVSAEPGRCVSLERALQG